MKKVGNFLIDMDRHLGSGQYGKVYLAQEIPDQPPSTMRSNQGDSSMGDSLTAKPAPTTPNSLSQLHLNSNPQLYACKVVERADLCNTKENLIVGEI